MFKTFRAWLIAAVSFVAASQPAYAEWLRATSPHFVVVGDMPEAALKKRVERLETYHAALRTLFKVENEGVGTIYMMPSLSELQKLAGSNNIGGFYRGDAQGAIGFVPERLPYERPGWTPEIVLFHEYAHHILLSSSTEVYPGWVSEGLAELFATADLRPDGSVVIGGPNSARGYAMTGTSRWSVERMLDSDKNPPKESERIELYTRGWLTLHYLLVSGKRPSQYAKFATLIDQGKGGVEAGKLAFGDLGKLDSELEAYLHSKKFKSYLIEASKLGNTSKVAIERMSEGEAAMLPFRVVSAVGVDRKAAVPLVQKARLIASRYPNDAAVQRALAEMEFDAEDLDRADAAADRSLASDPKNLMAMVYKGRIAAMRAVKNKDATQWASARKWFLAANKIDPRHAMPLVLYYDTFAASGSKIPDQAVDGLASAFVLAPADPSVRMRMGVQAIRLGRIALARSIMAPIAYDPHNSGKNPFAKLVADLDAGKDQAALLAKAKELKVDRFNEFNQTFGDNEDTDGSKSDKDNKDNKDKS